MKQQDMVALNLTTRISMWKWRDKHKGGRKIPTFLFTPMLLTKMHLIQEFSKESMAAAKKVVQMPPG